MSISDIMRKAQERRSKHDKCRLGLYAIGWSSKENSEKITGYSPIFSSINDETMVQSFADFINEVPPTERKRVYLYRMAWFYQDDGKLLTMSKPVYICNAYDMHKLKKGNN